MSSALADAEEIARRAVPQLEALVAVSSPSGDHAGAESAVAVASGLLPAQAAVRRPPCSTPGFPPDLLAVVPGTGTRRILLLGHLDTVYAHADHQPMRDEGDRLLGSGTVDMKGGVVLALGVARALARRPEAFAELAVLLVNDEEWRTRPFIHTEAFAGWNACLCFEAGELTPEGEEAVVVRRKAAGTLHVTARGRAAHSGSAPDDGRSALLALSATALTLATHHDPNGPQRLSVVPTVLTSGRALNVVPDAGELTVDMRADDEEAFKAVLGAVPTGRHEVGLEARMLRLWPGMDSRAATEPLLTGAARQLRRPICAASRGGASDASHLARVIPVTVDGLGPRGGHAHSPDEYVERSSLHSRAEVALALAWTALRPAIL